MSVHRVGGAIHRDYSQWMSLGPGGLPANPLGYVTASLLRPLTRDATATDRDVRTETSLTLPDRVGPRPIVGHHPIPHRQTTQDETRYLTALSSYVNRLGDDDPRLRRARSRFERRGDALYVREPGSSWARRAHGEIAHVHGTQASLHVVAAPDDVREIITRRWGERHPLAGRPLLGLPDSYLFVYAPRDDDEYLVVQRIVDRVVRTAL